MPPSSLEVVFKVDEGPKVKVGEITFDGQRRLQRPECQAGDEESARRIGIPYSIFFEDLFAKTYDSTKLEEDQQRIQEFYQDNGYFTAHTTGAKVDIVDVGGGKFRLPLIKANQARARPPISTSRIEEGRLYHLNKINFVGVKLFRTPETLMQPVFQMQQGDVFSTAKLRKGFDDLTQAVRHSSATSISWPSPSFEPVPNTDKIDLTLNFDEGKQFFVRRIDFSGNTTTRDKVIRRATADRRRRRLQHAPVGAEHSAPEPARLLRSAEGRTRRPTSSATPRPTRSISRSR